MPSTKTSLRSWALFALALALIGVFLQTGGAAVKDKEREEEKRPIITTADKLELDHKNRMATFTGTVVARQEQPGKDPLVIECDKMVIYYSADGEKKPTTAKGGGEERSP